MDKKEIIKYLTELRSDYEKRIKVNEENNQNFIGMYNIAYFNAITDVLNYINNNADNKNNKAENKITLKEFLNILDFADICKIRLFVLLDSPCFIYEKEFTSPYKIFDDTVFRMYRDFEVINFRADLENKIKITLKGERCEINGI